MKKIDTENTKSQSVASRVNGLSEIIQLEANSTDLTHIDRIEVDDSFVEIRTTDRETFERLISTDMWTQHGVSHAEESLSTINASAIDKALAGVTDEQTWAEVEAAFAELSQETERIIDLYDRLSPSQKEETVCKDDEAALRMSDVPAAPWVGAEASWRSGVLPSPSEASDNWEQPEHAYSRRDVLAGLRLSSEELETVRTSLPPPLEEGTAKKRFNPWKAISFAAILLISILVAGTILRPRLEDSLHFFSDAAATIADVVSPTTSRTVDVDLTNTTDSSEETSLGREGEDDQSLDVEETEDSWDFTLDEVVAGATPDKDKSAYRRSHGSSKKSVAMQERERGEDSFETEAMEEDADEPAGTTASVNTIEVAMNDEPDSRLSQGESSISPEQIRNRDEQPSDAAAMSILNEVLKPDEVTPVEPLSYSAVPELPSKDTIRAAMEKVASSVQKCKMNQPGRVVLQVIVSGETGRVVSSQVIDDTFRGTSTGLCAARAVKVIKLPAFLKEKLVIKYPFDL